MRRDFMVTALCLLILVSSFPALAEVRVVTDRHGEYKVTRVLQGGRKGNVWGPLGRGHTARTLNVFGDRNGDLFPTIRENRVAPHHPWVVWSRFNQVQYDLAWSRWTDDGWQPIRWVDPYSDAVGDSLDADLTFDFNGRPYVAWWRNEGGSGRIYISVFLDQWWMQSIAVSDGGVDSRYPTIEVVQQDELIVRYDTPTGRVEQTIFFDLPVTITDDINPLDFVYPGAVSPIAEED